MSVETITENLEDTIDHININFSEPKSSNESHWQFSSLDEVVSSHANQGKEWNLNFKSDSQSNFLDKASGEWFYKDASGQKISLTQSVQGSIGNERHNKIISELNNSGWSKVEYVDEFSGKDVQEIYFADEKGRISFVALDSSQRQIIEQNILMDSLMDDDDDFSVALSPTGSINEKSFNLFSTSSQSEKIEETNFENNFWDEFWNDILKPQNSNYEAPQETQNIFNLFNPLTESSPTPPEVTYSVSEKNPTEVQAPAQNLTERPSVVLKTEVVNSSQTKNADQINKPEQVIQIVEAQEQIETTKDEELLIQNVAQTVKPAKTNKIKPTSIKEINSPKLSEQKIFIKQETKVKEKGTPAISIIVEQPTSQEEILEIEESAIVDEAPSTPLIKAVQVPKTQPKENLEPIIQLANEIQEIDYAYSDQEPDQASTILTDPFLASAPERGIPYVRQTNPERDSSDALGVETDNLKSETIKPAVDLEITDLLSAETIFLNSDESTEQPNKAQDISNVENLIIEEAQDKSEKSEQTTTLIKPNETQAPKAKDEVINIIVEKPAETLGSVITTSAEKPVNQEIPEIVQTTIDQSIPAKPQEATPIPSINREIAAERFTAFEQAQKQEKSVSNQVPTRTESKTNNSEPKQEKVVIEQPATQKPAAEAKKIEAIKAVIKKPETKPAKQSIVKEKPKEQVITKTLAKFIKPQAKPATKLVKVQKPIRTIQQNKIKQETSFKNFEKTIVKPQTSKTEAITKLISQIQGENISKDKRMTINDKKIVRTLATDQYQAKAKRTYKLAKSEKLMQNNSPYFVINQTADDTTTTTTQNTKAAITIAEN